MKNNWELYISNNIELTETAYKYCTINFSHEELIKELSSNDEIKKQLSIININKVNNEEESFLLALNLVGKGGPIREAASFKINELIRQNNYKIFFQQSEIIEFLLSAITDINPSVSRNAVEIIEYIDNKIYIIEELYKKIFMSLEELKIYNLKKSYLLNKKTFSLYWNLEALVSLSDKITLTKNLEDILSQTSSFNDYTIREKCALLLSRLKESNETTLNLMTKLKNDDNIFVKRHLL